MFALFDTGADRDYLSRELATSLGLELKSSWMRLVTANQDVWGDQPTTNLIMESIDGSYQAIIQDALVGDFPTSGRDIPPARRDWSKYPHINRLSFIDLEPSVQVEIIISTAHMQSWMGIDSVQGESGGLVGIETRFGWTVSGTAGKRASDQASISLLSARDRELKDALDRIYNATTADFIDDEEDSP